MRRRDIELGFQEVVIIVLVVIFIIILVIVIIGIVNPGSEAVNVFGQRAEGVLK